MDARRREEQLSPGHQDEFGRDVDDNVVRDLRDQGLKFRTKAWNPPPVSLRDADNRARYEADRNHSHGNSRSARRDAPELRGSSERGSNVASDAHPGTSGHADAYYYNPSEASATFSRRHLDNQSATNMKQAGWATGPGSFAEAKLIQRMSRPIPWIWTRSASPDRRATRERDENAKQHTKVVYREVRKRAGTEDDERSTESRVRKRGSSRRRGSRSRSTSFASDSYSKSTQSSAMSATSSTKESDKHRRNPTSRRRDANQRRARSREKSRRSSRPGERSRHHSRNGGKRHSSPPRSSRSRDSTRDRVPTASAQRSTLPDLVVRGPGRENANTERAMPVNITGGVPEAGAEGRVALPTINMSVGNQLSLDGTGEDVGERDALPHMANAASGDGGIGSSSDDDAIGPQLPKESLAAARLAAGGVDYGGFMRPGEGSAIAAFVQQNLRVPRRGEVGWSSDAIDKLEAAGYVMSGSRHKKMNAVRLRKENQVYSAEEKRALALFNYEEKAARETRLMAEFREMLAKRQAGSEGQSTAEPAANEAK